MILHLNRQAQLSGNNINISLRNLINLNKLIFQGKISNELFRYFINFFNLIM